MCHRSAPTPQPLSHRETAGGSPAAGRRELRPRGGKQPALSRVPTGHLRFAFSRIVWRARRGSGALWDGSLLAHRELTAEEGSWGGCSRTVGQERHQELRQPGPDKSGSRKIGSARVCITAGVCPPELAPQHLLRVPPKRGAARMGKGNQSEGTGR